MQGLFEILAGESMVKSPYKELMFKKCGIPAVGPRSHGRRISRNSTRLREDNTNRNNNNNNTNTKHNDNSHNNNNNNINHSVYDNDVIITL